MKTQKPDLKRVNQLAREIADELRKGFNRDGEALAMTDTTARAFNLVLARMLEAFKGGDNPSRHATRYPNERDAFLRSLIANAAYCASSKRPNVRADIIACMVRFMGDHPDWPLVENAFHYVQHHRPHTIRNRQHEDERKRAKTERLPLRLVKPAPVPPEGPRVC